MILISQSKTVLLNFNHIIRILNAGPDVIAVDRNGANLILGSYKDVPRAVAVLGEIADEYSKYYRTDGGPLATVDAFVQPMMFEPPKRYEMPKE